jgi:hypothetical protein
MTRKILPGYDTSFGNKKASIWDEYGPKSYPASGGVTITAKTLGWGGFDWFKVCNFQVATVNSQTVVVPLSFSGTYFATAAFASTAPDSAVASVVMKWYVTSTGAEVGSGVDLSAEAVRVFALGV